MNRIGVLSFASPSHLSLIPTSTVLTTKEEQRTVQHSTVQNLPTPPSKSSPSSSGEPSPLELEPPKAPWETPLEMELLPPLLEMEAPRVAPRTPLPLRLVHAPRPDRTGPSFPRHLGPGTAKDHIKKKPKNETAGSGSGQI